VDSSNAGVPTTLTLNNSSAAAFDGVIKNSAQPVALIKNGGATQTLTGQTPTPAPPP
jgi:hypothetical protein